jgi:small subunit ribosomal protein S13
MVYLFDSELPENKSVFFALTHILGIGKANSCVICKKLGFSINLKIKNLSKEQIQKLITTIEFSKFILVADLKKFKSLRIKKLISIKSYRGLRIKQGLPIRGQRTHTNAKTARKKIKNF